LAIQPSPLIEDAPKARRDRRVRLTANRDRIHTRELAISNFRVATVTTTTRRVEEMIRALERITDGEGSNMFLFANEAQLAASDPLDVEWVSGKGEQVRLTD
jgi:hypothetical protein